MRSLTQQFTDWVRTKPADEKYDYAGVRAPCAFHQFLNAAGYPVATVGGVDWTDTNGIVHDFQPGLWSPLAEIPWTFGALASRLSPNPTGRG